MLPDAELDKWISLHLCSSFLAISLSSTKLLQLGFCLSAGSLSSLKTETDGFKIVTHTWNLQLPNHKVGRGWWILLYFVTSGEKSISANVRFLTRAKGECYKNIRRNQGFSLVANDTFHNKGEKRVFCSPSRGRKVRFSSLRCENNIFYRKFNVLNADSLIFCF